MRIRAPAKINLFLSVGAREPGGLHEIISVMQAVGVYDELSIEPATSFSLTVDPPGAVPTSGNVVERAVRAMAAATGTASGVAIGLHKAIPVAAGMAGGSADAAATLLGCKELWRAGISRKALEAMASTIGSDVPFCVRGGTAVVAGTGERLNSLPVAGPLWWVIGVPDATLDTAAVYAAFDERGGGPGLDDPFELADALARGDLDAVASALRNDLAEAAIALLPSIAGGGDVLRDAGALAAQLTGSGPAWIGLARDEAHAAAVAAAVADRFARVAVAPSLPHGPRAVVAP